MKKLKLTQNAVNKGEVLTRAQLKKAMGGMGSEAGGGSGSGTGNVECRLALRNSDGSRRGWAYRNYSVSKALSAYTRHQTYSDGLYISGYCCSDCPY